MLDPSRAYFSSGESWEDDGGSSGYSLRVAGGLFCWRAASRGDRMISAHGIALPCGEFYLGDLKFSAKSLRISVDAGRDRT
jgi:hypothetical protein